MKIVFYLFIYFLIFDSVLSQIITVSNVSPLGGTLSISGNNFGTVTSVITDLGQCTNFQQSSTSGNDVVVCTAPPGYGSHNVTLTNSVSLNLIHSYLYQPPTISSIYNGNSLKVTITGQDFGLNNNNQSFIEVTSDTSTFTLTNCQFIDNRIICSSFPNIFQGTLEIIAGTSNVTSSFTLTPFITSINGGEAIPINSTGPYPFTMYYRPPGTLKVFQGLSPVSSQTIASGVNQLTISYNNAQRAIQMTTETSILSNMATFEFRGPSVTGVVQQGIYITLEGYDFGVSKSDISANVNALSATIYSVDLKYVNIIIPDSALPGYIGLATLDGNILVNNVIIAPVIQNINPGPRTDGTGSIIIEGKFFYPQYPTNTNLSYTFIIGSATYQCQDATGSSPTLYKKSCGPIGQGSGSITGKISNTFALSSNYNFQYIAPTITSYSPVIFGVSTDVTIAGDNFYGQPTVTIGTKGCTFKKLETNLKSLVCVYSDHYQPSSTGSAINMIANVSGVPSIPKVFTYSDFNISMAYPIDNNLAIIGTNFSPIEKLIISLIGPSTYTLNQCTYQNSSNILCQLPEVGGTFTLSMQIQNIQTKTYSLTLTPVIVSIKENPSTIGSTVTVLGKYFVSPLPTFTFNQQTRATTFINSTSFTFVAPSGSGGNYPIKLATSNTISISYQSPSITNINQVENGVFSIIGSNFYTSMDNLTILFNNTPSFTISSCGNNLIVFTIPLSSKNGNLQIRVNGLLSNVFSFYIKPELVASTKPKTSGGLIQIHGNFFKANDENNFQIMVGKSIQVMNPLSCVFIDNENVNCNLGAGSGTFYLSAKYTLSNNTEIPSINTLTTYFESPTVFSSTSLYYEEPGYITITGTNFYNSSDLSVLVQDEVSCTNPIAIDYLHIQCYYDSSVSNNNNNYAMKVSVIVDGLSGAKNVLLYNTFKDCPKNCSNNGSCNSLTGSCTCISGYSSIDCSIPHSSIEVTPVFNPNPFSISFDIANFQFIPFAFREINSADRSIVRTMYLSNLTLAKIEENVFSGQFNEDDSPNVTVTKKYYNKIQNINFAGDPLQVPANSIKIEITVDNYPFAKSNSILQIIYSAQGVSSKLLCNNNIQTSLSSGRFIEDDLSTSTQWFAIDTATATLAGRFSERMFIDSTINKISSFVLPIDDPIYFNVSNNVNLMIVAESKIFAKSITIDPIITTYKRNNNNCPDQNVDSSSNSDEENIITTSDNSDKKSKTWVIPVAVVVSIVGAILVGGLATLIIKRTLNTKQVKSELDNRLKDLYK